MRYHIPLRKSIYYWCSTKRVELDLSIAQTAMYATAAIIIALFLAPKEVIFANPVAFRISYSLFAIAFFVSAAFVSITYSELKRRF